MFCLESSSPNDDHGDAVNEDDDEEDEDDNTFEDLSSSNAEQCSLFVGDVARSVTEVTRTVEHQETKSPHYAHLTLISVVVV